MTTSTAGANPSTLGDRPATAEAAEPLALVRRRLESLARRRLLGGLDDEDQAAYDELCRQERHLLDARAGRAERD